MFRASRVFCALRSGALSRLLIIRDASRNTRGIWRKKFASSASPWTSAKAVVAAAGVASHFRQQKKEIGYLWLDAHGDMNTPESSPSGNIHGMPLAAIMGYGAPELVEMGGFKPKAEPGNIVIVGARDLDAQERKIVKKSGVHVFTMRDIDERGMRDVMSEALKYAMDDTAGGAVSLDMDFVDPTDAPGVGTPVRGGATYREAHLAMEMIADTESMASMEVVEINPIL